MTAFVKKLIGRVVRETRFVRELIHPTDISTYWDALLEYSYPHGLYGKKALRAIGVRPPRHSRRWPDSPEGKFISFAEARLGQSHAQLFQDILALYITADKRRGFFVEFGATDGLTLSNTALLERERGWAGILSEPAPKWKEALSTNRRCTLDFRCVWKVTGENLSFTEADVGELSGLSDWVTDGNPVVVETVSLNDLLKDAPHHIEYLSVDTEGSEYEILSAFDFSAHHFDLITVEHNFEEPKRSKIRALMAENGYHSVLEKISRFDDWFVREPLPN